MGRQRAELMLEVGRWCAFGRERLWQCARSGVASQLPEPGGMHRCCVQIPRTSGLMVGSDATGWLWQCGCQGCRGAGVVLAWGGGAVRSSGRCLRHVGWLGPVVPPALRRLHCSSTCATSSLTWGDTVGDKWQLSPSRRAEPWHSAKMGDFDVIRQGRWRR